MPEMGSPGENVPLAWRPSGTITAGLRTPARQMSLSAQIAHVGIWPARHLLDLDDESGALEHRERLLARREVEALVAAAREAEPDGHQLLRVGDRVPRIGSALLGLHDQRPALAECRCGVPQNALLILER